MLAALVLVVPMLLQVLVLVLVLLPMLLQATPASWFWSKSG